jgi:catechol 2,3-dioxygenase-like lactoylglutathione lyase family enzyme
MLRSSSIIAFVATQNPARAKAFYEEILGLRLLNDESFAIVFDANGIMLRVQKVEHSAPPAYTSLGWMVDDILAEIEIMSERGVMFEDYPGLTQEETGICKFSDGTQVAWFKDPDGNLLSVTQHAK